MRRRGKFWRPKMPAHIRAWGAGIKHSAPFAKRDRRRRAERLFVINSKRTEFFN